jgi:hypothetical protein
MKKTDEYYQALDVCNNAKDYHNMDVMVARTYVRAYDEAINYNQCCTELPMIEELIISEIRRKHQKQVDDEIKRFLSGNGTDCRLRGFFS